MSKVIVYSSDYCPYCMRAKALLENKGDAFEEIKDIAAFVTKSNDENGVLATIEKILAL